MKQFLEVGRLINTHGIKGEMKLEMWCDGIEYLKQLKTLYLDDKGQSSLSVVSVRPQKNHALISFKEITSADDAEYYKNKVLYCDRGDAKIEDGANYIQDLIGCYVVNAETEEEYGRVADVVNYGASDILEIESGGKRRLVPMIPDIVKEINTEYQVIRIIPMKGLFNED